MINFRAPVTYILTLITPSSSGILIHAGAARLFADTRALARGRY